MSEDIDYFHDKKKIGKPTTLIPVEELTTLRADLQRVTRERKNVWAAFKKAGGLMGLKTYEQRLRAYNKIKHSLLAAVKPDMCKNCGNAKDCTVEGNTPISNTCWKPIEQKEV